MNEQRLRESLGWDVAVVGAGAAGLLAAARAAERGLRTLLLEKNRRAGVKILMSGGTRCNLTHDTDGRGIVAAFGPQGQFLHSALAAFGPGDLVDLIEAEGVATKVEPGGKIFPASNRAADVLAALMRRLERSGAVLALGEPLRLLERAETGFRLTTEQRVRFAAQVILATGGQSYPGSGTTGDGYAWAARLGHTIVPPRPALAPVSVADPWRSGLQGVTMPDVKVCVRKAGSANRPLDQDRGSLLFAHFGLSGPVVLNVSRAVSGYPRPEELVLECDFLPEVAAATLHELLQNQARSAGKKLLANVLGQWLPRRLCDRLLAQALLPAERRAAGLSRAERERLVQSIKSCAIPITGTLGFRKAEVTAGGVSLAEVDSRTMESKLVPGLFLAGEMLDLDGRIGGYNFQAAFSTGWAAGNAVGAPI